MTETPTASPIAAALAAAQAELRDPGRNKTGQIRGRNDYKYAGLDDLLQAIRPVLAKHGIAISQPIRQIDGKTFVVSELRHAGGEVLSSAWELKPGGTPQERGSELSYGRRYSLEALVGVAASADDDGALASDPEPTKGRGRNRQPDTTPTVEDRALADRVAAERAAKAEADAARKAQHHPSWEADRASFFGEVSALGFDGEIACAAIERATKGIRPSAMDPFRRAKSLAWLGTDTGAAVYTAIVAEREQLAAGEVAGG